MLKKLSMNSFFIFRQYLIVALMINLFSISVFGKEKNCLSYPYPEGIFWNNISRQQKQLIYTKSVSIRSKNMEMIEFIKEKTDLYASSELYSEIEKKSLNLDKKEIGLYKIYSCFDNEGTYKSSYAQRFDNLKSLSILQKIKYFIDTKFKRK